VRAQGLPLGPGAWAPGFNHKNQFGAPGEVEQPPVPAGDWLTINSPTGLYPLVPGNPGYDPDRRE
jgi:hypothetical protein